MDSPFGIAVQDKAFAWQGNLGDPVTVKGSVVANGVGQLTIQVKARDSILPDLLAQGARCRFVFRDQLLLTGMVRTTAGKILPNGTVSIPVQDDARVLANTVALVRPAAHLEAADLSDTAQAWQTQAAGGPGTVSGRYGYFRWTATTYEGAVKEIIRASLVDRLGGAWKAAKGTAAVPVAVAPDQGRGGAFTAAQWPLVRMGTLQEAIAPLLLASGLRVDVFELGGIITVDVAVPGSWDAALTAESGVVADGDWSIAPPIATRYIFGGPGEDAARAFWAGTDTAREAAWGDVIELFKDATGATVNWPSTLTDDLKNVVYYLLRSEVADADKAQFVQYKNQQVKDSLAASAAVASLTVQLAESEGVKFYGAGGLQLLDTVQVNRGALGLTTDRIASAEFDWSTSGLSVKPAIGTATTLDPFETLAAKLVMLAEAARKISRDR